MRPALLVLVAGLLFCGCYAETEPATVVGHSVATLNAKGSCEAGDSGAYRYAWRKAGAADWKRGPLHPFSCADAIPGAGLIDIGAERVHGLEPGTAYEFRLESAGGWADRTGAQLGTDYERFTTRRPPLVDAPPSRRLGDTIGINTRTAYKYTNQDDYPQIKAALAFMGIRHIRDGLGPTWQTTQRNFYRDLAGTTDVRVTMGGLDLRYGNALVDQLLQRLRDDATLRSVVDGIEHVNEPDAYTPDPFCSDDHDNDSDDSADGRDPQCAAPSDESEAEAGRQDEPTWPQRLRDQVRYLHEQVEDDPLLSGKPVVGPSFGRDGARRVGDVSPWIDYGNFHPYRGNGAPGAGGPGMGPAFADCAATAGPKPCQATEVGYHTALDVPPSDGNRPVDEATQAVYSLRMVLEHYRLGIRRTDFYTLVDQADDGATTCAPLTEREGHFGFWDCLWRPKPVALAMHNFTSALMTNGADNGSASVRLALDDAGPDVQRLAFRAPDGRLLIALWRNVSIWDTGCPPSDACPQVPAPDRVEVALGAPPRQVVRYHPASSPQPVETLTSPERISVELRGEPVVLSVLP